MSTTTIQGQTTFAFDDAIKRIKSHMQKTKQDRQIQYLPRSYPQHPSELSHVDIVAKSKILRCHLEDAFPANRFSVKIKRRIKKSTLEVHHDNLKQDEIRDIATLYGNKDTCVTVDKFNQ